MAAWFAAVLLTGPAGAQEGLVAHWRFDTPGAQVQDLSGHGHTATVTSGQVLEEQGVRFLRLDGKGKAEVPSAPDLNLRAGFSAEMRVRLSDLSDGRLLIAKEGEYLLRVDWPSEASHLSFFVDLEKAWEPRVSAFRPETDVWHHVVATWDGSRLLLWADGVPQQHPRHGPAPAPTDNPVCIGGGVGLGAGLIGDIEYVRLYARALTPSDVIRAAYAGEPTEPTVSAADFDFRQGLQGWSGREGAEVSASADGLLVKASRPSSLAMHRHLQTNVDRRDFVSLRMAVDRGSRAALVFVTTQGAARVPFQTCADGAMHTYMLEPWEQVGWGGDLLALGVMPSETGDATATLRQVRVTEEPAGEGELRVQSLFTEAALPRIGRPERVTARLRNIGGPVSGVRVTLSAPRGVEVQSEREHVVPAMAYREDREVSWTVRAAKPVTGEFAVEAKAQGAASARLAVEVGFGPVVRSHRADYVPEPVPAKRGPYTVWTHYCPLWKHGTHMGWKVIEPYPERKPVLGWYNEGTPEVADWHIKYWLEHGITGVIYCWYRSSKNGPVTQALGHAIHDGLLKARYLPQIGFGIMWENGCGQGAGSVDDLMDNVFPFWLDNYLTHPSYLKIDGKPVLYIWVPGNVTRDLGGSENVRKTFDAMRAECRERGLKGLYIVGCVGGADRATLERMAQEGWDATSAYGNGWVPPRAVRTVGDFTCAPFEGFVDQQEAIWKGKAEVGALPDITAAMMGWDSRPWNETPFFWSENTPAKFRDLCLRAKAAMDAKTTSGPEKDHVILCCWNEFGEGHYIEPTRGYGFAYPDIIREVFTGDAGDHVDLAPDDVGLGPYDSWYAEARAAAALSDTSRDTSWSGDRLAVWSGFMGLEGVAVKDGVLRATSITPDPAFSSPRLEIRANRFTRVVVEMRVSKPGGLQLFWTTASEPSSSERASLHATTQADGEFHRYTFEVGLTEYWGGCVTGLRLDPTNAAGVTVEIRSIGLE
jgi:hypothetical protein